MDALRPFRLPQAVFHLGAFLLILSRLDKSEICANAGPFPKRPE